MCYIIQVTCFHTVSVIYSSQFLEFDREKFSINTQKHFVVFFNRSIFANSFGECILQKMNDDPIDTQGALKTFTNACIGPVPAFDTFKM